jgi:23S rRNA (uracil1939-C5)-methyltransferase
MPESHIEGDRHRVVIEKLVYGGDGLSRTVGQTLFVPFALPGEEVQVEAVVQRGKILRAASSQILSGSPHRVQPGCDYFGKCGGCHYQHADYEYQLAQKVAILRETLARLGRVVVTGEISTVHANPWHYRNRIKLHFDKRRVGYREAESHKLCPIATCPIASPKLNEVITIFNGAAQQREWPTFLTSLEIFTNERDVQLHVTDASRPIAGRFFSWCGELVPGFEPTFINYESHGRQLRIGRGTFFQVNRFLVEALVTEVVGRHEGETAIDLYAGAGLFALSLSERFKAVTAVERSAAAYRDLVHNCGPAQDKIVAVQASTDEFLAQLVEAPDLVIADPPRTGLTRIVAASLLRIKPPRIVLVSCDPATLARDLEVLTPLYSISRMALIDLFPQTFHFETVVHLERKP